MLIFGDWGFGIGGLGLGGLADARCQIPEPPTPPPQLRNLHTLN